MIFLTWLPSGGCPAGTELDAAAVAAAFGTLRQATKRGALSAVLENVGCSTYPRTVVTWAFTLVFAVKGACRSRMLHEHS